MITAETKVREEGVVVILDDRQELQAICWKDTSKNGEVRLYRTERIPYGDIKDFFQTLVDVKKTNG